MRYIIRSAAPHHLPWVSDNITDQFETPQSLFLKDNCDSVHESNVSSDYMGNMHRDVGHALDRDFPNGLQ